jgi:hypothetical protein
MKTHQKSRLAEKPTQARLASPIHSSGAWIGGFIGLIAAGTLTFAQSYSIPWSKISGGGGTSTGGGFTLSGTIGQQDAGARLTGGGFSLVGGYWSGLGLVQTPEAPFLTILLSGSNAVKVCWPHPSTGWVLQQNADLNSTNWVNNILPVTVDGEERCVTFTPPINKLFLRLAKP